MKAKTHVAGIFLVWLLASDAQSRAQDVSAKELAHRALERRAVEGVIWGMPAVNFDLMHQAMVDAFWSISVYNAEGHFQKNTFNAYNSIAAKKVTDGSVIVQFGGCDGKIDNCLPIMKGWNYMVRLYRPRKEILDGTWTFSEAQPQ